MLASDAPRYARLFSPFQLGGLALANRLAVPGLTTNFAHADGSVSEALCTYLGLRAQGGFGLVICENIGVLPGARAMPRMLMGHEDRFVPGLRRLAQSVKRHGVPVIAQLSHPGRQTKSAISGHELVAPSAIPCPINRETPRALARGEIPDYEQAYVRAAERMAEAGFDGVEIHGAHGYLVAEFLSAYANAREDDYGGALVNRMRFLVNIVEGIRARLGRGFALMVRISAREFVRGGIEVPEAIEIGRALAARGVDGLSVSVGVYESFNKVAMVTGDPEGEWLATAGAVRAGAGLPVMGVGRIVRGSVAEDALAAGQIDLAAIGRASIADAELPRKLREGREREIRVCMSCNICLGRRARPESICPINPALGRESGFIGAPSIAPKRIAIVGTSLAALSAAWIAAARGHAVILYRNGAPQGGLTGLRAKLAPNAILAESVRSLLGRATDAGAVLAEGLPEPGACDELWGLREFRPVHRHPPRAGQRAIPAIDVLRSDAPARGRAAVIGDDLCAAEAAVYLALAGAPVTLVSPARDIAMDAHPGFREVCRRELAAAGAAIVTGAAAPFDHAAVAAADYLALGRGERADWDAPENWIAPPLPYAATRWLEDAYEPGLLTRAVYNAVDAARALP